MYYEGTYLVVKPGYANAERELLEREVRKILHNMDAPSGMKRARGMSFQVTRIAPLAAVTATVAILCFAMI